MLFHPRNAPGLEVSMDGKRNAAIEILEKRMEELKKEYDRDLAELKQAVEKIKADPPKKEPKIVRGRWEGMSLTDGIHAYLLGHNGPVPFHTLMEALQQGGVRLGDPEKPNRYAANVKTTIINNKERFRYDKKKDTVKLLRPHAASASA